MCACISKYTDTNTIGRRWMSLPFFMINYIHCPMNCFGPLPVQSVWRHLQATPEWEEMEVTEIISRPTKFGLYIYVNYQLNQLTAIFLVEMIYYQRNINHRLMQLNKVWILIKMACVPLASTHLCLNKIWEKLILLHFMHEFCLQLHRFSIAKFYILGLSPTHPQWILQLANAIIHRVVLFIKKWNFTGYL